MRVQGFNPRTRRACDFGCTKEKKTNEVSIHARVERATRLSESKGLKNDVSIHARVERATRERQFYHAERVRFNPRTRRACDFDVIGQAKDLLEFQSTHA